jgi:hypothetical protein
MSFKFLLTGVAAAIVTAYVYPFSSHAQGVPALSLHSNPLEIDDEPLSAEQRNVLIDLAIDSVNGLPKAKFEASKNAEKLAWPYRSGSKVLYKYGPVSRAKKMSRAQAISILNSVGCNRRTNSSISDQILLDLSIKKWDSIPRIADYSILNILTYFGQRGMNLQFNTWLAIAKKADLCASFPDSDSCKIVNLIQKNPQRYMSEMKAQKKYIDANPELFKKYTAAQEEYSAILAKDPYSIVSVGNLRADSPEYSEKIAAGAELQTKFQQIEETSKKLMDLCQSRQPFELTNEPNKKPESGATAPSGPQ